MYLKKAVLQLLNNRWEYAAKNIGEIFINSYMHSFYNGDNIFCDEPQKRDDNRKSE